MLCILTCPRIYHRLQAEIDSTPLTKPVVRDEEARALVYLQAVILESLRVHPPAIGLLSKVTPPEGDTINGVFVPGGVNIGTSIWALMRNTHVFGQDAEIFRPERWLNVDKAKYAEMYRVADMAFGSGRFKCLGRTIAFIEMNKIFVEVFNYYRTRLRTHNFPTNFPANTQSASFLSLLLLGN
jgi:cytochrome P450